MRVSLLVSVTTQSTPYRQLMLMTVSLRLASACSWSKKPVSVGLFLACYFPLVVLSRHHRILTFQPRSVQNRLSNLSLRGAALCATPSQVEKQALVALWAMDCMRVAVWLPLLAPAVGAVFCHLQLILVMWGEVLKECNTLVAPILCLALAS